jgi:hypothetical protein
VFDVKDYPLAYTIINNLDTGYIIKKDGKNAYILVIDTLIGLIKIINLINGKFRSPLLGGIFK